MLFYLSILIPLWTYITANPVNRSSVILAHNRKEEKLLSAFATKMGSIINILLNDVNFG